MWTGCQMNSGCSHLDRVGDVAPSSDGCEGRVARLIDRPGAQMTRVIRTWAFSNCRVVETSWRIDPLERKD